LEERWYQRAVVPAKFARPKEFREDFIAEPIQVPGREEFAGIVGNLRTLLCPNVTAQRQSAEIVTAFQLPGR
jgi:hypothetical protein